MTDDSTHRGADLGFRRTADGRLPRRCSELWNDKVEMAWALAYSVGRRPSDSEIGRALRRRCRRQVHMNLVLPICTGERAVPKHRPDRYIQELIAVCGTRARSNQR